MLSRILVLTLCFTLGCDDNDEPRATLSQISEISFIWGRDNSNNFQEYLCNVESAFSITLGNSRSNAPVELKQRRLCGVPRPYLEPSEYTLAGNVGAVVYSQSGEVLRTCTYKIFEDNEGLPIDYSVSDISCNELFSTAQKTDSSSEYIAELYLSDFVDANNIVLTAVLKDMLQSLPFEYAIKLYLSEDTYLLREPIVINRNIEIIGVSPESSTLLSINEEMTSIIEIGPYEEKSVKLKYDETRGSNTIYTDIPFYQEKWKNCNNLVIKDVSQLWPFDERHNVFYGEVSSLVFQIQNVLILSEPLRSSYNAGSEVRLVCPVSVSIENIGLTFSKQVLNTKAMVIVGGNPVTIKNVNTAMSGRVGIWISESHDVKVSGVSLKDGYPEDCNTCYGIQTYGSQDVLIENNTISGFRRGIDISGNFPSRRVVVKTNTVLSESEPSRGASALGTHGSAEEVIFQSNVTIGGIVSLLSRGNDIVILNNQLLNPEYSSVYLDSGAVNYVWDNELGGYRLSGNLTGRGIEFHIQEKHELTKISGNSIKAKVGVRIANTPVIIEILDNKLLEGDFPVVIEEGVVIDEFDNIEYEW